MRAWRTLLLVLPLVVSPGCDLDDPYSPPSATRRFAVTPTPAVVTVVGSLQSELGCSDDWQPACAATHLAYDADDLVWQGTFYIPAGNWEYKATLNDSWDENYGSHAQQNGANIPLSLSAAGSVKFYYSHETHWITHNHQSVIVVAAGSFQSELGCSGDWQPDCLRSWLQDPDGDGVYTFETDVIPAGDYETKITINESWSENYGADGVRNGANIAFTAPAGYTRLVFSYDGSTHVLTVATGSAPPQPDNVTIPGSLQSELGCSDDWQPACAATHLEFDATDGVWQGTFHVPAGNWEYKAALNDSWAEQYGLNAVRDGANIPLNLAAATSVKFYYDHATHWITDNHGSVIVVAPGNFQSELGCEGDWQPDCLRSWLKDPDGDGTYAFSTRLLPPGSYEAKVAVNESWSENYGADGVRDGANIGFTVPVERDLVTFTYDATTHVLQISTSDASPAISSTTPANGTTGVSLTADLGVTFSEPVTVSAGWFAILCGDALQNAAVSGGPTTFTLDPDSDLPVNSNCTVNLDRNAIADQDTRDPPDHPASNYSWSFQTRPPTADELISALRVQVAAVPDAGLRNGLRAKLNNTQLSLAAGLTAEACKSLGSMLKDLQGKASRKLPPALIAELVAGVHQLQGSIGCSG